MTQFAPPPGYVPSDQIGQTQPDQTQPAQQIQPVQQAQPAQATQPGKFAPPPGYVPSDQIGQPTQPVQSAAPAVQSAPQPSQLPPATNQPQPASPSDKGVVGSLRRTLATPLAMYHAFSQPATDEEKASILAEIRAHNAKAVSKEQLIPEEMATNPSTATMAYRRLIQAPADLLYEKGNDEKKAAEDLWKSREYWHGGNMYLSSLADKGLSVLPMVGPYIAGTAERAEHGDVTGALTDIATAHAIEPVAEAVKAGGKSLIGKVGEGLENRAATVDAAKVAKEANQNLVAAHRDDQFIVPSTKTNPIEPNDRLVAESYLEQHHANVEPIRNIKDYTDALDHSVKGIEDQVAEAIKIAPEDKLTGVLDDVKEQLGKNQRGKEFVDSGLKEVKALNLDDMTMERADAVRRQLNAENEAILQKNKYDRAAARASDPGFAAREAAANSIRAKMWENLEGRGIEGVPELRQDEGSLLAVRDAAHAQLENGEKVVKGSSEAGRGKRILGGTVKGATTLAGVGAGSAIGAVGGPFAGSVGAMMGGTAGAELGETLSNKIASPDLTRNAIIERRFARPPTATVEPAQVVVPKGVQPLPEPAGPAQGTLPETTKTPAASTKTPTQGSLFATPETPPAALQSPQAELNSLKAAMRPLQAILNDPTATAAAKAEASRQLANLPLAGLQNPEVPSAGAEAARAAGIKLPAEEGVQETPLDIPANRMRRGEGTVEEKSSRARDNEWGHVIVGHDMGFEPKEIISHNHENIAHTRTAAETHISVPQIPEGKSGLSTDEAIADHLDKVLTTVMAGPAANEVHSGLSLEENPMSYGDLQFARNVAKEAGLSPEAGEAKIQAAYEKAKNILSEQHARDILREYSDTREPGLDKRFHASNDRIKEATSELDKRRNAGNNRGLEKGGTEHAEGNAPGSKEKGAGESGQKAALPTTEEEITEAAHHAVDEDTSPEEFNRIKDMYRENAKKAGVYKEPKKK